MMQKICAFISFRLLGWKVVGELPRQKKILIAGMAHTSNWDFPLTWLVLTALDLDTKVFAKDVYHTWPLNYFCKFFGVLPVNRRKSTGFVESVAQQYIEADTLRTLIAPEGTRKFSPKLKSGYYHIAKKANVPIVAAGLNYSKKEYVFLSAREALDSYEEDEQNLIEFCKTVDAKYPDNTFQN